MKVKIFVEKLSSELERIKFKKIYDRNMNIEPSIYSWTDFSKEVEKILIGWHTLKYLEDRIEIIIVEHESTPFDDQEKLIEDIESLIYQSFNEKNEISVKPQKTANYYLFQPGGGVNTEVEEIIEKNNVKVVGRYHQVDEGGASGGFFSIEVFLETIEFIKVIKELYDIGVILIPIKLKEKNDETAVADYETAVHYICEIEKIYPGSLDLESFDKNEKKSMYKFKQNITEKVYNVEIFEGEITKFKRDN